MNKTMKPISRTKPIHVPGVDLSRMPALDPSIYTAMGQTGIFRMLSDFYSELERSAVRPLFPEDMQSASRRSAAFYVQLLGGPPMYNQLYGAPMMRRRHFPFEIDEKARIVWRDCFYKVLENAEQNYNFPGDHLPAFRDFIEYFSQWMVNAE